MAAPSSHMWYVKAAGGVWGPYPGDRISAFVAEGRVRADTPVSPWAQGPFASAADSAEFAPLFLPADPAPSPPPQRARTAAAAAPAPLMPNRPAPVLAPDVREAEPAAAHPAAALRPLLVWAQLSASSMGAFQAALQTVGPGAAIRPGLWLVQGRLSAAALRNRLSRHLSATDVLLVVQAPRDQAAWFNLDPDRDRELRRVWAPG